MVECIVIAFVFVLFIGGVVWFLISYMRKKEIEKELLSIAAYAKELIVSILNNQKNNLEDYMFEHGDEDDFDADYYKEEIIRINSEIKKAEADLEDVENGSWKKWEGLEY